MGVVQVLWGTYDSPPKLKIELSYDLAIPLLGIYIPQIMKSRVLERYLHTHAPCNLSHNSRKAGVRGWVSGEAECDTPIHHSALEREEILTHAATWMGLEDITLNEVSQKRKDTDCMVTLT